MAASDAKYCVVMGCKNTEIELNIWRRTPCFVQSHLKKVRGKCGCPAPFLLFHFPHSDKLRSVWLEKLGLEGGLEINQSTCVCSIHFENGRPTPEKFYPTLYMQIEDGDLLDGDSEDEDEISETETNAKFPVIENSFHYEEEEEECDIDQLTGNPQGKYEDCSVESSNSNDVESITDKGVMGEESDDDVEVIFQAPKVTPLAQFDPNQGVLQISNPILYIQECHKKIAELTSENASLRSNYENEVKRLKEKNNALKRKLATDHDEAGDKYQQKSKRAQVQSTD